MRARQARKQREAFDRLHGRNAKPSRSSRGGSGRSEWVDEDDLGDLFVGGLAWLAQLVFKIFDD